MISLYDLFMLPLEKSGINKARKELIPLAKGNVLEIGSGSGINLKHYNFDKIDSLTMSDISLSKKIQKIASSNTILIQLDVEELPFEDNTFDYVIHTLVFCSVTNVDKGLSELRRILKPGGTLLYIEHILPEKKGLQRVVNFINPVWSKVASGCNLNREYEASLLKHGFKIVYSSKFMRTIFVYGEAN